MNRQRQFAICVEAKGKQNLEIAKQPAATFNVYFAGALFTHKDLTGNALLAMHIEQVSQGRYACVLPQELEPATGRAVDIRNQDLKQLMACDLGLFNFDGAELDSGTVVEFMLAKFLDMPSVIVRSDFRAAGDQDKDGDAWNLMCSFYPRTRIVHLNAMAWYQQARQTTDTLTTATRQLYHRLATAITEQLDAVRQEKPLLKNAEIDSETLYLWASRFPGGGFADVVRETLSIAQLINRKRSKGLI